MTDKRSIKSIPIFHGWKRVGFFAFLTIVPLTASVPDPQQFSIHLADANPNDQPKLLAADQSGNLFTVSEAQTSSPNSPAYADSFTCDIRITKTDASGNILATFTFGGSMQDTPYAAAIDPQGNIVIVGSTTSTDFPLITPLQATGTGFVAKVDGQLTKILYSTRLGVSANTGGTRALAVTLDSSGNIFVAGDTGPGFTTTPGALQTIPVLNPPSTSGFVAEIAAAGDRLIFSTVYAGSNFIITTPDLFSAPTAYTSPTAIALDSSENVIIAGTTDVTDLAVTPGAWTQKCGCTWENSAGFVAKIGRAGAQLIWGTYVPATDSINGLAIDSQGDVVFAGSAQQGFPVTSKALQLTVPSGEAGTAAGFVAELNVNGSDVNFATYFGGNSSGPAALAIDNQGTIWVTGGSATADLPPKSGTTILGKNYIAGISSEGSTLLSLFTAPTGSTDAGLAITTQGTIAALGQTGWLVLSSSTPGPYLMGIAESWAPQVSRAVCGRELLSLYGINIGPAVPQTAQIANGVIPNRLGGTQVLFDGVAAALLYAGPTQINLIVPSGVAFQENTSLEIVGPGGVTAALALPVEEALPQVFMNADGAAAAVNQDGTLNSPANPAAPGSIVAIWLTGGGAASPAASDNTINTGLSQGQFLTSVYAVDNNYQALEVDYSGDAPAQPSGIIQINFRVPDVAGSTNNYFEVQIGSGISSSFNVFVH
jgi:uncharacterized protein (TIGR03437 family)